MEQFRYFDISEHYFLSEHFHKSNCSEVCSPAVSCILQFCNFSVKKEPHFIRFSGHFSKISVKLFQNTFMKRICEEFNRVPVFSLELPPAKTNFWKFWRWDYHRRNLRWVPFLVATYNISQNRHILSIILQVIV